MDTDCFIINIKTKNLCKDISNDVVKRFTKAIKSYWIDER